MEPDQGGAAEAKTTSKRVGKSPAALEVPAGSGGELGLARSQTSEGSLASSDRPSSSGGTTNFLFRFVSSFRAPLPDSTGRPTLIRSTSSPLVTLARPRAPRASMGSSVQPDPKSASSATLRSKRFPFRRATSSSPLPSPSTSTPTSPMLSQSASSSIDQISSGRTSGEWSSQNGDPISSRRDSSAATPLAVHPDTNINAVPSLRPLLENPLLLVATLLPPALLLLSNLGPAHLFSPPLILPAFDTIFNSPASVASTLPTESTSDATPEHSRDSSFSLPPSRPTFAPPPLSFSHELHAPSTISVPAVSAAAIWTIFKGLEWVGQVGASDVDPAAASTSVESDGEDGVGVFDFPALLQGVADVLAADAASRGVELVIGRIGVDSAPSPVTTPPVDEQNSKGKGKEVVTRELLVKADERAWAVALIWILHHVLANADPGSTVEVRFQATPASQPTPSTSQLNDSQATALPTRKSLQQWWTVALEIMRTNVAWDGPPTPTKPILPIPPFDTSFAKSLFAYVDFNLDPILDTESGTRQWDLTAVLPTSQAAVAVPEEAASLLGRRRASLEGACREPTVNELTKFAESGLRGTKVELRSGEKGTFAKHLATYLAGWGMDVNHVALDVDDFDASSTYGPTHVSQDSMWNQGRRENMGRYDSGFGGSSLADRRSSRPSPAESSDSHKLSDAPDPSSSTSATSSDVTPSFIIIDDDIATLKRLLLSYRPPSLLHYAPTLLNKRPQLASRRTRSSTQVRQISAPAATSVIIHFASLTHYKAIKDTLQFALATTRSSTLPEVLVIPKPAGPRRIITALWTATKRPAVDPSLPPIATSPTSPGVQYWTPRLSPAVSNQQDFDTAAAEALAAKGDPTALSPPSRSRTPPTYFPSAPFGHPPSPLGKISDEQVSYFSCVAETMDGTSPSEGMVVQSPNGRPAIYFQPQPRTSRVVSVAKIEAEQQATERDGATPPATSPQLRGAVSAPHEIGLGQPRRGASISSTHSSADSPSFMPPGTPALTLDSFIAASKSRAASGANSPEQVRTPLTNDSSSALQRSNSGTSVQSRPSISRPTLNSTATSPRSPSTSVGIPPRARAVSPPMSPRAEANNSPQLIRPLGSSSPVVRSALPAFGRSRRNTARKSPLPAVPPINVLIVEDNPINQTILSMFMKKKGIRYAVANNGEEAVQKWKGGGFHLVLMDIQLPVKDGIEATREIRAMERDNNIGTFITTPTTTPNSTSPSVLSSTSSTAGSQPYSNPTSPQLAMPVIIVALTASSLQADRVKALAAGCNDFLTKPVSLLWLQVKLTEWGSMAYLSSSIGFSSSSPRFRAGLAANAKADTMAGRLHIDRAPLPFPALPVNDVPILSVPQPPSLNVISPSPNVSPAAPPLPAAVPTVVKKEFASSPTDLSAVDRALETVVQAEEEKKPDLGSVVAEGARLASGRSRSASIVSESLTQVLMSSGTFKGKE